MTRFYDMILSSCRLTESFERAMAGDKNYHKIKKEIKRGNYFFPFLLPLRLAAIRPTFLPG